MKRIFTLFALFIALTAAAEGTLTVEAPSVVSLDETFRVVFTADGRMSDFNWPGTSDFDVVWGPQKGSMSSVNIVGGKRTSVHQETVTYLLQPKATGKFAIAGATAKVDKKEVASNNFSIEVVGPQSSSQPQASQQSNVQESASTTGTVPAGNIFLRLSLSKTNVVKGEPITATLKIYTREDIAGFEDIHFPTFNGFWSKETVTVQNLEFKRENVGGEIYNSALLRKYMLIPQQSGKLTIDPAEMVCQLRVRNSGGGRSIFDDFFDSYQTIRKRLYTDKITVNVRELPAGAPSDFGGGVGEFKIKAELSKNDIKSNEAASLSVTVSGTGNISMIEAPKVSFPGDFEVYDIKSSDNIAADGASGSKNFEYPFIPRSHGEFVIPPIKYSYYDIGKNRYVTTSTDSIHLSIAKGVDIDGGVAISPGINRQGVRNLSEDVRYIAYGNPMLKEKGRFFAMSPLFFSLLAVIVLAFIAMHFLLKFTAKRKADIAGSRNRKANKMARTRLRSAEAYLKNQLGGAYYEELHKALLGYISDKLIIPAAELSKESIAQHLSSRAVSQETIDSLNELIAKCEFARYSPSSEQIQMENEYNEAVRIISQIESEVKSTKSGKKLKTIAILAILSLSINAIAAENQNWSKAAEDYAANQWQEALDDYKAIEAEGLESADLYYNIGNCYFKLNDTPHAILYFEKALKLDPSHSDALHNLEIARQFTLDKIDVLPEFVLLSWSKALRNLMSADNWAWITIALLAIVAALMLMFMHSGNRNSRKLAFIAACITFVLAVISFICSFSARNAVKTTDSAVVTSPVSSVKSSPSESGNAIFILHEGTKVRILDQVGDWTKIEISDGRQGWLKVQTIEEI